MKTIIIDPGHVGNDPGATFQSPKEGVLAQLQHLYVYSSTEDLSEGYPLVDSRFTLVQRGSATYWTNLNGK
ncbi:hypothetical protein [Bacillus sp. 2205SS5-2]|uniref:hypothetical protein n=1 Tax=Bacillus sp. 2205SS5-2 TaxID=3109031 RepID=UPI00300422F7